MDKFPKALTAKLPQGLVATIFLFNTGNISMAATQLTQKSFQLKAVVDSELDNKGTQLSRNDIVLNVPASQPPLTPFPLKAGEGANLNQQASSAPELPASSMYEYGVDWSKWVGMLADRWFCNLKGLEERSRLQFHTARPALIKFTCYPNGQIDSVMLKQSSGIDIYDQMQIQSLLQITPLPPFPDGTQRTSFTLVQGWESHPRREGESDYRPGSFGRGFPVEIVKKWLNGQ